MCGRTRISLAPKQVEATTGVPRDRWVDRDRYQPSHNVSPGAWTPILCLDQQQQAPMLQSMRWGLVPSFTKPGSPLDFFKMFNARSESVAEKFSFSRLLSSQRCVVLLEGFYEWKTEPGGKKQPYYVSLGEGKVLRMAGLYDVYTGGEDGPMATYTILTTDSCSRLAWLHNRMPVLLEDDAAVQAWLHGQDGKAQVPPLKICGPCNSEFLTWHPVTTAMSKAGYNKPDASVDVRKKKGAITSFFKASPVKKPPQQQQQQQQHSPASQSKPDKREVDKQQQQQQEAQQQQAAVRNSDEETGPTAADEAAAAAQVHAATTPAGKPPPAAAAAAAATPPSGKAAAAAAATSAAGGAGAAARAAPTKRGAPEPAGVIDLTAEDEPAADADADADAADAAADTAPACSRQESSAKKTRTA